MYVGEFETMIDCSKTAEIWPSVIIPYSNLKDVDMYAWCEKYKSDGKFYSAFSTDGSDGLQYYFENEQDAIMFKLKFA